MRVAVFVDGANYFFAQRKLGWNIDAEKLLQFCAEHYGTIEDAYYYIGTDTTADAQQQAYLNVLANIGYSLVTKPIKTIYDPEHGESKQKANLDVEIVLDMFNTLDNYDVAVLVSGDGDFERALQMLKARGKRFEVISTSGMVAKEIRQICGMHYVDFQDIRDQIERKA